MPPGWDGIETISRIWKEFPDLQIVICTAYSDYSWDEIAKSVGNTDKMLVLKKPFDNVEVLADGARSLEKMAAHPDGAKTDGGIGCACKPAHCGIARRQRPLDRRSSRSAPQPRKRYVARRSVFQKRFTAALCRWRFNARRERLASMLT
jgi:CheY-like chemotaxis protein